MNKKYQILSVILIVGYAFFFTTRLWNIDDRPRFNSWATNTMVNSQGNVAISQVVYVSPIDALDIILDKTSFVSYYEFVLEAVVHRLDGTSDVVPLTLMNEKSNRNVVRQFVRAYLEDENLDWHFVEIALIDEANDNRVRLTMDWRMVDRIDNITTAESYDLSFGDEDDFDDEIVVETQDNTHDINEYEYHDHGDFDDLGDFGYGHFEPDLSLEGLNLSLDGVLREYAFVSALFELNPDDDILRQSIEYYEAEIQRLEALIEGYHNERN